MAIHEEEEAQLLPYVGVDRRRVSIESKSSVSTTSLVFDRIEERVQKGDSRSTERNKVDMLPRHNSVLYVGGIDGLQSPISPSDEHSNEADLETAQFIHSTKAPDMHFRRLVWVLVSVFICAWALGFFIFIGRHASSRTSELSNELSGPGLKGSGKRVTLDEVMSGQWRAQRHEIGWIEGTNGEDGLLLERQASGKDYLVVEDIRGRNASEVVVLGTTTLMKEDYFDIEHVRLTPSRVWPSRDMKTVLIATDVESNWRHSFYARYWIFDVATQTGQPLDPKEVNGRVQLASWSPQSDAIVFTRDNNMFLRYLSSSTVIQITKDGGSELFYGIPDWVYEEEVFSGNSATWWAEDGKYIAFMRTNESAVPEYPIEYFVSRPSGVYPPEGQENYPDVREIKYPKAGAPNPTVTLQFYDLEKGEIFGIETSDEFADDNRLITEVLWAGSTGKVLVRETNRESDLLRVVLLDVMSRTGKTVRTLNVAELDGGWFEVSQNTRYIPADPAKGRAQDGYIDTIIHENYDHLGYFTPLDNPDPILLTSGNWEVVSAPSAVDLENNLVYFVATKESPTQRHVYSVRLNGADLEPLTDITQEGYYTISFSSGAKYALLNYDGPKIPWQKVISTRSNENFYEAIVETNEGLTDMAKKHELPTKIYSTVTIDGFELQVVERLPPHFNEKNKHPVLFYLYGGPGSQTVNKAFTVDFQSYIASSLGYIVVTVDGRGTGFIGREARCIIRGNIGYWESRDQIETAKMWARKKYVDPSRLAIWGWSYGGFMTLKTLEQDAGQTFSYGMAVAPVTDWHFYDSIYTERYMRTPQHNYKGYLNASISNMTALHQNVRFLLMHGIADDNVHLQNSLTLLDALDLAGVENYDVHVFPDSDHGIYFHNANRIVFDKLSNWLINAFNGEWLKTVNAKPLDIDSDLDSR